MEHLKDSVLKRSYHVFRKIVWYNNGLFASVVGRIWDRTWIFFNWICHLYFVHIRSDFEICHVRFSFGELGTKHRSAALRRSDWLVGVGDDYIELLEASHWWGTHHGTLFYRCYVLRHNLPLHVHFRMALSTRIFHISPWVKLVSNSPQYAKRFVAKF